MFVTSMVLSRSSGIFFEVDRPSAHFGRRFGRRALIVSLWLIMPRLSMMHARDTAHATLECPWVLPRRLSTYRS